MGTDVADTKRRLIRTWLSDGPVCFQATHWENVHAARAEAYAPGVRAPASAAAPTGHGAPPGRLAVLWPSGGRASPARFVKGGSREPGGGKGVRGGFGVEVGGGKELPRLVALDRLKANPARAQMGVVRKGNRLSVQPVTQLEFDEVVRMASRKG